MRLQVKEALALADAARKAQGELKKELVRGEITMGDVLRDPRVCRNQLVGNVLCWDRGRGESTSRRICLAVGISPLKLVSTLTERQIVLMEEEVARAPRRGRR